MVDERGKLFGKLNLIDLLVILLLIVAVALIGWKVTRKDGASNASRTILTYTVEVEGVDQEVYEGIKAYVPGESGIGDQLMANGEMVDAYVTNVTAAPHEGGLTMTDVNGTTMTFPVEGDDTLDLTFTIQANVVNSVTNEVGTQEVRIGKSHIVKTVHFELNNGTITTCEAEPWAEG
ncbi:MAG TPA: DUF4330 domain-containing protein [Candidatus Intestinimonas merdavium]|uniref:DUF4330 domain-containing protein n=1 Tax=Candidatus Intestinimonas merdavium TaxID=2838622 RepID=A0A9D1Z5J1_9FIRM|nr:DUF4330 domain-containing protein [Candidatus Intestinimonas merdavium]